MGSNKIMKILAANFLLRGKYYSQEGNHYMAEAYENAFEMLAYACNGNLSAIRQFGWSDDAEDIVDNLGDNVDFWDLQEYIDESEEYPR